MCIDSTHGTNAYNFNLTSVVVIDEFGEGIPVGWMISNREDTLVLVEFLKAIRHQSGPLSPLWFMTDDAQQYYTACRAVFGANGTKKILCAWHIDRAWRKALHENIEGNDKQIEVYHQLRLLLTESVESQFRVLLQEFLSYTKQHHKTFFSYFKDNYCNRVEQWAPATIHMRL